MHPEEYREAVAKFIAEATERWERNGRHTAIVEQQPEPHTHADLDRIVEEWKRLIVRF
jgi:hypothetical protein